MATTTTAMTAQSTVSTPTTVMAISHVKLPLARKSAWKGGKALTVSSKRLEHQNVLRHIVQCQQLHIVSDPTRVITLLTTTSFFYLALVKL